MRRTKEEAAATRDLLLRHALAVFTARGYAATTLDDIARAAGLTRGAVYWHFDGKAALYDALVGAGYARFNATLATILGAGGSPLATLRRLMAGVLAYVARDSEFRAVVELTLFRTETAPELAAGLEKKRAATDASLATIADLVRAGIAAGQVRAEADPAIVALGILGFLNGTILLWLQDQAAFSLAARADELADTFLRGIVAG